MRFSRFLCPTLRQDPSEAEVVSHRLMLRSGMIRQIAAGIYDLLPLGLRILRNVEKIVREEMDRSGALEVLLPAVHPAVLWQESGRWDALGKELLRIKDRGDREYCFGPTHEEVITDLVRREVRSYRDLPKNLYQIQVKFRDEVRPRFGLMRCREFTMKDAYSFDVDDAAAEESYRIMREAYLRIFTRCGLDFCVVRADSGNIGGSLSEEFMVLADSGEDEVLRCSACAYAANSEKAESRPSPRPPWTAPDSMRPLDTPRMTSVKDVAAFLKVPEGRLIKTLIYKTQASYLVALLPGDREVNETKLKRHLNAAHLALASAEEIERLTGGPVGFSGPVELECRPGGIERIVCDVLIAEGEAYVTGGNRADLHLAGAVAGRDFSVKDRADVHAVKDGDSCPECGKPLASARGIEVGHIFKLGVKYSRAMEATFTDRDGTLKPAVMGCYGIGIGRTAAAAIEQYSDAKGMILPPALAPFDVIVVGVAWQNEAVRKEAERCYDELKAAGFDCLLDDREETAGAKFNDADLLGIPVRVTVGAKGLAAGKLEAKKRWEAEGEFVAPGDLAAWVRTALDSFVRSCQSAPTTSSEAR